MLLILAENVVGKYLDWLNLTHVGHTYPSELSHKLTPVAGWMENAGQPGTQVPPRSSIALLWMELGHPNHVHHEERTVCSTKYYWETRQELNERISLVINRC